MAGGSLRFRVTRALQIPLFGHEEPSFDRGFTTLRRTNLGAGAWFEHGSEWVSGQATLFEALRTSLRWRSERREMYERMVDVPRLYAVLPEDGREFPILEAMRRALSERYGEAFERVSAAYYRDGRDSVAWHGDTIARKLPEALVATVSLGGPRRFFLRPTGGGRSIALSLGLGDLLVMGGSSQRTFQHSVPKVKSAPPRISVMFRPVWNDPSTEPA
jgi:alkylated DNA repair dioxygenase AlkB